MRRVFDARIARLAAERTRFDSTTGLDNCTLRAWTRVCDLVRDGLVRAGIDPESATALQLGGMAAHMTDIADKPEVRGREEELAIGGDDGLAGVSRRKFEISRDVSRTDASPIWPLPPWPSYSPGVWRGESLAADEHLGQTAFSRLTGRRTDAARAE